MFGPSKDQEIYGQLESLHGDVEQIRLFLQSMAEGQSKRLNTIVAKLDEIEERLNGLNSVALQPKPASPVAEIRKEPVVEMPVTPEVPPTSVKAEEPVSEPVKPQAPAAAFLPLYFGAPNGNGFETTDRLPSGDDARALYVVERVSETQAKFYPLTSKLQRLKSNAASFLLTMCDCNGDLENATEMIVSPQDYGTLSFADDFWELNTKCTVDLL